MGSEFIAEIRGAIERDASLEDYASILRKYRDRGLTAQAANDALRGVPSGGDARIEDRVLEVLDIVAGWCRPDLRVWSDSESGEQPTA